MGIDTNIAPALDDLAGWKDVEHVLSERIGDQICSLGLVTSTTLRQYFGCKDEEYLLEQYQNWSVMHAFIEWLVNDYRPIMRNQIKSKNRKHKRRCTTTRKGRTLAQRMLGAELPSAEAMILQACSQAHPSIFRITDTVPGKTLALEDILLGDKRIIQDKMLSQCVQSEYYLVGRVFPVGQFYFFAPAGPPLPSLLVRDAIDYLESLGVELTREGLLSGATKFGQLWKWYDQRADEGYMPKFANTDGEELVLQTASFSVADEVAIRKVLNNRDDIDYDEQEEEYLWFREQDKHAMIPGDVLNLGHMRFVLDELIIEVNSAERLKAARQWLEEIPGVKFEGLKTREIGQGDTDVPLDDRMGPKEEIEITPELTVHVQESFHEYYMNWLDNPLPILEGKSPRQMCKTKTGRQKVAMMIRTIPVPTGNQGLTIDVPRQQMLQELGLESH